jgi:hypothetical protein
MNTATLTDREKWDVGKMVEDKNYYFTLPGHRRTAAVSLVAVLASGHNLEHVPETVLNREICRAALNSKDADCTSLSHIPFPDVQREGVKRFISSGTPAFVAYSFMDITDVQTAREAVKADAYCLQLVPDRLLTKDICRTAVQSPNADDFVKKFVSERFPSLKTEQTPKEGKIQPHAEKKLKI